MREVHLSRLQFQLRIELGMSIHGVLAENEKLS